MINLGERRNNISSGIAISSACRRSFSFSEVLVTDAASGIGETIYVHFGGSYDRFRKLYYRKMSIFKESIDIYTYPANMFHLLRVSGKHVEEGFYVDKAGKENKHRGIVVRIFNPQMFFEEACDIDSNVKCCACKKGSSEASKFYPILSQCSPDKIFAEALCEKCYAFFEAEDLRTGTGWRTYYKNNITSQAGLLTAILERIKNA